MVRFNFSGALGICATLGLLVTSTAAIAASWTPEGAQHWVEVAHKLNAAANADTQTMGAACRGFTLMGGGSELRHEAGQAQGWAVKAHANICVAYQSYASNGQGILKSHRPCEALKTALGELGKAKAGQDPDEVVAAAGQLSATLQSLMGDMKDMKSCKFARTSMF